MIRCFPKSALVPALVALTALPAYAQDAPWWDADYAYRQRITITNNIAAELPTGYSTRYVFDHASLVPAKSQASGDDVRIVFWNGSANVEIDRIAELEGTTPGGSGDWNTASTRIWFATQRAIAASAADSDYYIYYDPTVVGAPPADRANIYLWYDDFSTNTVGSHLPANAVVSTTGTVTDPYKAVDRRYTTSSNPQYATLQSAGASIVLDMGLGEEIVDREGTDFIVYESGGGESYEVAVANAPAGLFTVLGNSSSSASSWDLGPAGVGQARYVRITQVTNTPDIQGVHALNMNLATGRYANGRMNDLHGSYTNVVWHDPIDEVARFDTGDDAEAGLRMDWIEEENLLVQVDINTFRTYPINGTASIIHRWTDPNTHFYTQISNGSYNAPLISLGTEAIGSGSVDDPGGPSVYFCPVGGGTDGGADSGVGKASTSTTASGLTGTERFRYGIYQLTGTNNVHRLWQNTDTDGATIAENLNYNAGGYATSGVPAIQAAQQWGFFDNLIARRYVHPEPSTGGSAEQPRTDYKVVALHPTISPVALGETDVQILRLTIAAGAAETVTSITLTSKNTNDADVVGVSCYYTGPTPFLETTAPFGAQGQTFSGGTVTFNGSRVLGPNTSVNFFFVYDVAAGALLNNFLDARIDVGGVTIEGTPYPAVSALPTDPPGSRQILPPNALVSVVVDQPDTSDVRPADTDQVILRLAFTTSGSPTGAPPAVRQIRVTSANSSILDVPGVTCWYTDTDPTFTDPIPFGVTDQPFGGGIVTFTGLQDLPDGGAPGTFYFFVTYRISATALGGNLVDARILANDVTVDTLTYPPVTADPPETRLIQSPTGNVQNLPPVQLRARSNPQLDDGVLFTFDGADGGDADAFVDSQQGGLTAPAALPPGDSDYGGLRMSNANIIEVVQELWTEFTYDLSSYGIIGRDINTVTFKGEMYLTGNNSSNPSPSGDTADFYGVNDAQVQIYNWTTGAWEAMGPAFLRPTGADWENPPSAQSEGIVWNNTGDDNPERPLIRSKYDGWTDDYLNASGELKTRVWISCTFNFTAADAHMIFDYAVLDFSYGARTEEAAYIWTDELEGPVSNINGQARVGIDQPLHLRVGIRSNFKAFPGHYLGLEMDTDPDFPSPTLVTQSSADVQMWDDAPHAEGDAVTPFRITGATDAGIYHEDEIPPAQNKTADLLYEEDFTVIPRTPGTYYLRVVRMNSSGGVLGLLEAYNQTIVLKAFDQIFEQTAFDWAKDVAGDETALDFEAADVGGPGDSAELEFTIGQTYFLTIQVTKETGVQGNVDWQLQFQDFTGGAAQGPWTSVQQGSSGDWTMVNDTDTLNTIPNASRFTVPRGVAAAPAPYAAQAGEYSDDGTATSNWNLPNFEIYTEWMYSLQPHASAAGKSYRFRLIARTNSGAQLTGVVHTAYPVVKQTWREQVSTRIAGENEAPVANENAEAQVSVGELLHLRVGLRANHNPWSAANIALQYDTDPNFGSPTLMTPSTPEIEMWDDADHLDGDAMTGASLLSGLPAPGTYHESNDQPVAVTYAQDVLVEEDFTLQIKTAGTYYVRIVEVDAAGAFVAPLFVPAGQGLDPYTQVAKITAVVPINFQTFTNWAPDGPAPLAFQTTDSELEYLNGIVYILAVQVENRVGATQNYTWQLQYQKINGTPGSWTSITSSSADWRSSNGVFGIDLDPVPVSAFACNGGNPRTAGLAAESGFYTESGSVTDTLDGNSYTEYWFVIKSTALATGNRYTFRVTNGGSTANFFYEKFGRARQSILEQTAFRWADSGEAPLGAENVVYNATLNETLHVRVGLVSHNGTLGSRYFALQYADDFNFTSGVTLMTRTTPELSYWDDPSHAEGSPVSGLLLSGGTVSGVYHEDEIPPAESPTADTLVEEDFTVRVLAPGTYFMRVVRVDSLGTFIGTLDQYTNIIQVTGNPPSADQSGYRFADDAVPPLTFDPVDTPKELTPASNLILAIRISNLDPMALGWDWQLQYQRSNGTPGPWIDVTAFSADWQSVDALAGADGDPVGTGSFVTNPPPDTTTAVAGQYSETGKHAGFVLPFDSNTEFRYAVLPTAAATGNAYRFRVTNSGSTTGWQYSIFPVARHTRRSQVSSRWATEAEVPLEGEDVPASVQVGQLLHLRVGIRSDNSDWGAHKLALQVDTAPGFPSPLDVTTAPADVVMWDDSDRSEGSAVASVLLSGVPTPGVYHEVQDQSATQTKSLDVLYEEDFTVRVNTAGVYYLRVVDFSTGSSVPLDVYPLSPIQVTATVPDVEHEAYVWAPNTAPPAAFQSQDVLLQYAIDTPYLLVVRLENTGVAPRTLDWRLQYQRDPTGTPGPWKNVSLTSNEWRAVDGLHGDDGDTVLTGDFATSGATANAVAGAYSETGVVPAFQLDNGDVTELWYAIKPIPGAELALYRFRVTDDGDPGPFIYQIHPEAAQRVTEQVSFRWADPNEAALASENTITNALVGDQLHLRVATRSNHVAWPARRQALQYASDINFTSGVTLMTETTPELRMWNDPDHVEGDPVSTSLLSGPPASGTYHEDEIPPVGTAPADAAEEQDFTVEVVLAGTYFIRVVEVDGAGAFLRTLDQYTTVVSLTGSTPTGEQTAYNWTTDGSPFVPGNSNTERDFAPPADLILAIRANNPSAGGITSDWQLQYQKVNGTPGPWTDVTAVSTDWRAFDSTLGNQDDVVATGSFTTPAPGAGAPVPGRYSETGRVSLFTLGPATHAELWYAVQATSAATGNRYVFRLTNSGSPTGILYLEPARARHIQHEQVSFRFANGSELPSELEDFPFDAIENEDLHLRLGVRSNNDDWAGARLGIQFDTAPDFTAAPAILAPASSPLLAWDDTDHVHESAPVAPLLLSGSPTGGRYHESNLLAAPEPVLTTDALTEEDYTLRPVGLGTFYARIVEIDGAGAFSGLLDKYPATPIRMTSNELADTQAASNWAPNAASPTFQTPDTTLEFQTSTAYIVALRLEHSNAVDSTFAWQLQYQRDPNGTPGPWTSITPTSTDWRAVAGPYAGPAVPTASFATGAGVGTPVAGVYSETGVTSLFTLSMGNYTEVWFSVQPQPSAADTLFRFRVTNAGSPRGFLYAAYGVAAQLRTRQVSYRWADENDLAGEVENVPFTAATGQRLHLRAGIQGDNIDWSAHRLAVQFSTDITFATNVRLLTTSSTDLRMWDDLDHPADGPVSGPKILSGAPADGAFHESSLPASQTKNADTLVEEDFSVEALTNGTYYLRVVEVDGAGAFLRTLERYDTLITLSVRTPTNLVNSYDWAEDAASPTFLGDNQPLFVIPSKQYVLAFRVEHNDPEADFNWQIEYQKDPFGTPGPWTLVTTTSADWRFPAGAILITKNDGDPVLTGEFAAATPPPAGTARDGVFDRDGSLPDILSGARFTEYWFILEPLAGVDLSEYRFRLTDSSSASSFTYGVYPEVTGFKRLAPGGVWSNGGDWTPPGVPIATDNCMILGAGTVDQPAAVCNRLIVRGSADLAVDPGQDLTVNADLLVLPGGKLRVEDAAGGSTVTVMGGTLIDPGAELRLAENNTFQMTGGTSLRVLGTLTTRAAGGTSPLLTRENGTGELDVRLLGVVDVDGLEFHFGDFEGIEIAPPATLTQFRNVRMEDGLAAAGASYLTIRANTLNFTAPGCYFGDVSGTGTGPDNNVSLTDLDGGNDVYMVFEDRGPAVSGPGAGEAYDFESGGSLIEWTFAANTRITGEVVGFPTAALDWNTFVYYSTYVVARDVPTTTFMGFSAADRIWVLDADGDLKSYFFEVDPSHGRIVGIIWWDTEGSDHVVYFGTTNGYVYKLIDDGASLQIAPGGWPFSDASLTEVTSPVITDRTNVFFGGIDASAVPRVYGLTTAAPPTLKPSPPAVPSPIRTAPAWDTPGGTTYLYLGTDTNGTTSRIYRVDTSPWDVGVFHDNTTNAISPPPDDDLTTDVVAPITLFFMGDRIYVGESNGYLHSVEDIFGGFTTRSPFPFRDGSSAAITGGAFPDIGTGRLYYGDAAGQIYILAEDGSPWALNTNYFRIFTGESSPIEQALLFIDGMIYAANTNGKLYCYDETTLLLEQVFNFGGGVKLSDVAFDPFTRRVMIGTDDGRFLAIPEVADPTP